MKNSTKFLFGSFLMTLMSLNLYAGSWQPQGDQSTCGNWYITSNAGWSNSEYYKIIDIDAATLTDPALPKFTAADGAKNAIETGANIDFKSGVFTSPVLTTTDFTTYTPTNVLWPVKFRMAAFAPTMYTSAWSKMNIIGSNPSGSAAGCTFNDNSIKKSAIFDKPGFIELCRIHKATATYPKDSLGFIEIDSLPAVERIQWSYSATSYKRGVKLDLNFHDGNGWIPRRWVASDYNNFEGTFSEQGYQFEEVLNQGANDGVQNPLSYVSMRIRIWDGDSLHFKVNANDLSEQANLYTATMKPTAYQTVRVHQIKVFSGIIPTVAPIIVAPNAVASINANNIKIFVSEKNILLSEDANVEVYSVTGEKLYKGFTRKVDVSGFSKGIYIIKAVDSTGKIQNKKIMI